MAGTAEIKAQLYNRLTELGFPCRINYRYNLDRPVRGYKVVVLDVAIVDGDHNPVYCFYVGKSKSRKLTKYSLVRVPHSICEGSYALRETVQEFTQWFWGSGVKFKKDA